MARPLVPPWRWSPRGCCVATNSDHGADTAGDARGRHRRHRGDDAATASGGVQQVTLEKLEAPARRKGWRLPEGKPVRTGTVPLGGEARIGANVIVGQIAVHPQIIAHHRAQAAGKGDLEMHCALNESVRG